MTHTTADLHEMTDDELLLAAKSYSRGYFEPVVYEIMNRFDTLLHDLAQMTLERDQLEIVNNDLSLQLSQKD